MANDRGIDVYKRQGKKLAKDISDDTQICAVLMGNNIDHLAQECFEYGAEKVYMVQDPLLENYTTDAYTKVMKQLIDEYKPEIVLYGATHIGRDFAPRKMCIRDRYYASVL